MMMPSASSVRHGSSGSFICWKDGAQETVSEAAVEDEKHRNLAERHDVRRG